MTHDEAIERASVLNRTHPDRRRVRWLAREADGEWQVARMTLPAGMRVDPVKTTSEAKPRPSEAPDPRSAFVRNVGGPYGAG